MRSILFVDDEPHILNGLSRMLRPQRHAWNMEFVSSGAEALTKMQETPFDVLITDMRMPVMDGAELLRLVAETHPEVVRMVLSGHSDARQVMGSVGLIHQFLAKPCDATTLRLVIERVFSLQDILAQDHLRPLVSQTQALPSPPSLYVELINALQSPDADARTIGEVIARDIGVTAKILQIVNSAFFGLRREITSPAEAVAVLGVDTTRALVLSMRVFAEVKTGNVPGFSVDGLSRHSVRVAVAAKAIARSQGVTSSVLDNSFLAGLLHDVGKLLLAASSPFDYAQALEVARREKLSELDGERRVLQGTHPEVGAYLLGIWGLPSGVVEAVAYHHEPSRGVMLGFEPLVAVHVANACEMASAPISVDPPPPAIDVAWIESLGLANRLDEWREICGALH